MVVEKRMERIRRLGTPGPMTRSAQRPSSMAYDMAACWGSRRVRQSEGCRWLRDAARVRFGSVGLGAHSLARRAGGVRGPAVGSRGPRSRAPSPQPRLVGRRRPSGVQTLGRRHQQARVAGCVRERSEHGGRVGAERSVDERLEPADPKPSCRRGHALRSYRAVVPTWRAGRRHRSWSSCGVPRVPARTSPGHPTSSPCSRRR